MSIIDSFTGNTAMTPQQAVQSKQAVFIQMTPNELMMVLFLCILGAVMLTWIFSILYKILIAKRFPYDITLKYVINGRCIVKQTKARIRYRKGETEMFIFKGGFFKNLKAPIPPEKTVEILGNGRMYVKGYVRKTDNVVWAEDNIQWEGINPIGKDENGNDVYANTIDEKIQPITQQHRSLWFDEMRKAERDKVQRLGQILLALAPFLMIIIIFVMVLVFWKDITNPIIQAETLQKQMKELDIKIIDKLNVMYKIQNGSVLTPYDRTVFNDTEQNRFNSQPQVLT